MNIVLDRPSGRATQRSSQRSSQQSSQQSTQSLQSQSSQSRGARAGAGAGVQDRLTEDTFANFLDGFQQVTPQDLVEAKGGRVRYVIEGAGGKREYRLGGWLTRVDPALRYLRLVNPYAKKSWSVQLQPRDKRVRLYYMPPGTSDEVATLRNLLTQIENGAVRITKAP
jgi:hypothetical protein